jgi:mono/diheme cytochrome c family protein
MSTTKSIALGLFSFATATLQAAAPVTFTETIAPIILQNCASCHRPGEAAPFSLLTYEDVRKKGALITAVTKSGYMPPWHAEHGYGEFADERRLTPEQIALIDAWVKQGMPQGDPAKMPPAPKFADGWHLGKPDLIVEMPVSFELPASGSDIYRNFVIPTNLTEDKWVRAVEFRPSARKAVHHVLFAYDGSGNARRLEGHDGHPGFGGMSAVGVAGTTGRSGSLGGWAVGATAAFLPEGLAFPLPKGSDLLLQMHFHLTGKPETERSTIGIYFADKAPERPLQSVQLPALFGLGVGLDIPPGATKYTVQDSLVLPVDVTAYLANAHAHYLAQEFKATATLPNGTVQPLLWIKDWDFNWQGQYRFKDSVVLPAGTRVDMEATFDNSANNPRNPNDPPKFVRWGEQTTDEMAIVFLQCVTSNPGDRVTLFTALFQQMASLGGPRQGIGRRGGGGAAGTGAQILQSNPDAVFRFIAGAKDTVTRQEFLGLLPQSEQIADLLFMRLDTNADGVLTIDEFRNLAELLRPRRQ